MPTTEPCTPARLFSAAAGYNFKFYHMPPCTSTLATAPFPSVQGPLLYEKTAPIDPKPMGYLMPLTLGNPECTTQGTPEAAIGTNPAAPYLLGTAGPLSTGPLLLKPTPDCEPYPCGSEGTIKPTGGKLPGPSTEGL